jgi:hypothetical protein
MKAEELYKDNLRDTHWLGKVVENKDPLKLGRCRIMVYGKFDKIPVESIPWASSANSNMLGAHSSPKIGDIVSVRFDNGDIYHPEYTFTINSIDRDTFRSEILDAMNEELATSAHSILYDRDAQIRIYYSPNDGLIIAKGEGAKERPIIQIDEMNKIKISTDQEIYLDAGNVYLSNTGESGEDTAEPAVRGKSLEAFLEEFKTLFNAHIHPTGMGPSGVPTQPWVPNHTPYQQENK